MPSNKSKDSKKDPSSHKSGMKKFFSPMYLYSGFVILFSILLFTITSQEAFNVISNPINAGYAKISSILINVFGESTAVNKEIISSPRFSLAVKKGCDAIAPMILLFMAIIAFPTKFKWKVPGVVVGISALVTLNIIRIVSLYFIGANFSTKVFDIMHIDIWQILFLVFTVFLWLMWMNWMRGKMDAKNL